MPGASVPTSDSRSQPRRSADSANKAANDAGLLESRISEPLAARLRKTTSVSHWQPHTEKMDDISVGMGGMSDDESLNGKTREKGMSTAVKYIPDVFRRARTYAVALFVITTLFLIFRSRLPDGHDQHHNVHDVRQQVNLPVEVRDHVGTNILASSSTRLTEYSTASEDSCKGRRVFMYDLPPEFNVVVHKESRCRHSLIHWMDLCPRFSNKGYGENLLDKMMAAGVTDDRLDPDAEDSTFDLSQWYDSDFYMLEMIFHTRFQTYRCLTTDVTQADGFFVPYYTGLLALDYLYDRNDLSTTFETRKRFGVELIQWLETNGGESWTRFGGVDHFLIMGRTSWDFHIQKMWGTGFSALPYVANMTALTFERDASKKNEQAIPYPTAFHPKSKEKLDEWIQTVRNSNRTHLFSYVGAPRPESWSARGMMSSACENAGSSVCNKVDCSVVKCSHDPIAIHTSFLHSRFCLQPRGDSATRKSTFDCLISGAIPVFFHVDSAYTQYSWHLPLQSQAESYSVFIDENELQKGTTSILDVLRGYSDDQVDAMREKIMGFIVNLLYVDFPGEPWSSRNEKDAFELSVERVLEKIALSKEQLALTMMTGE